MSECSDLYDKLFPHIKFGISIGGFVLTFINIVTFSRIIKENNLKDNLFKYLLTKSIIDFYIITDNILFGVIDLYFKKSIEKYYPFCIIRFIIDEYIGFSCQLISMFCEVASCFNRYRSISNRFKFFDKIHIGFKLSIMFIYSGMFYSYKLFQKRCKMYQSFNSSVEIVWKLEHYQHFLNTPIDFAFSLIHSLIRDGLCSLFIICLNIMLFFRMSQFYTNKIRLNKSKTSNKKSDKEIKLEKQQKNLVYMVLATSTFTLIGHILMFVYYLPFEVIANNRCLRMFSLIFFYLSISINFVSYFIFNLHFRKFILFNLFSSVSRVTFGYFKFDHKKNELSMSTLAKSSTTNLK